MTGEGRFTSPHTLAVETTEGRRIVRFSKAIIAAGSEPVAPGFIPKDPRIWDSTGALELRQIPNRLLVLGGGIIGLEMATVYEALGAEISVIEMMDQLMPGVDADIVAPFAKRVEKRYRKIRLETKATKVEALPDGLHVSYEGEGGSGVETFDAMLVSVGRRPNGLVVGAEHAGVAVDERGFIAVDKQMRTNVAHIFAIGDIVGPPMLAHKASHEGKVAAEAASGQKSAFDAKAIPAVAYTDPEVAWVGVTETEAKAKGIRYGKAVFPWAASGRSLSARPRRGRDQDAVGRRNRPPHRLRDRRSQRRRPHRRSRARHRNGVRCGGHRPYRASPPDAVGDFCHVGRGVRGDADGPLYTEEEVSVP